MVSKLTMLPSLMLLLFFSSACRTNVTMLLWV
jgi:hypothetical protein